VRLIDYFYHSNSDLLLEGKFVSDISKVPVSYRYIDHIAA